MASFKFNVRVFKNLKDSKYLSYLPNFKEEKTRKFSSIVFSLLALSFFGLFAINPTLSTIAKLKKELSDSTFVDVQLQEKILNLSSLQEKYTVIEKDTPVLFAAVPKDPQVPLLIAQIQTVAERTGMQILGLQSSEVELIGSKDPQKKYSTFTFSFSGRGNYNDITKFMSTLTNIRRIVSIDIISISKNSSLDQILNININGTAYFKE